MDKNRVYNIFYQLLLFVYRTHTSYVSAACVAFCVCSFGKQIKFGITQR